eukprot:scaffold1497_cov85-Skeletonema_dohrnii-CCMP3373.AAC.2
MHNTQLESIVSTDTYNPAQVKLEEYNDMLFHYFNAVVRLNKYISTSFFSSLAVYLSFLLFFPLLLRFGSTSTPKPKCLQSPPLARAYCQIGELREREAGGGRGRIPGPPNRCALKVAK